MGTTITTKTITENQGTGGKSTWTIKIQMPEILLPPDTSVPMTITFTVAKGSDKTIFAGLIRPKFTVAGKTLGIGDFQTDDFTSTTKDVTLAIPFWSSIKADSLFNSSNSTTRALPITMTLVDNIHPNFSLYSWTNNTYQTYSYWDYQSYNPYSFGTVGYITLDAPPIATVQSQGQFNEYYRGLTPFTVTISNATAQYDGYITESSLTIGDQTVIGTGNGTLSLIPNTIGTFTPTVSVTDSRGQVTTKTLDPITVYEPKIPLTILNSQRVTNGVRLDMIINCTQSGAITSTLPAMTLYNMDGTQITLPYTPLQAYVRCYGVVSASHLNQVPSNNLSVAILNASGQYDYTQIGYPSTATPTQIKQEGETNLISPTIDVTNVRFNPETTGINKYTVGDVIGVTTTNMTKSQTNVDGDVKHIVTHASNIMVNATTTLQDWITEQYNNLT